MDEFRVGMISGQSRLDDSAFLFSAWNGLRELGERPGIRTSILEAANDEELLENAKYLAHAGYGCIWAVGYNTKTAVEYVAPRFPGCVICAVDMSFTEIPTNVVAIRFDEHKGSFLAGYLAARATTTGRVGFVGGVRSELIGRFEAGYRAGVAYGSLARADGEPVEIEVRYTNSFVSFDAGRAATEELYDAGCDTVFHAAGAAGRGVIRAAKDKNRFVIGVDKDQSFLAPTNVISSMIKRIDSAVVSLTTAIIAGTQATGREITYGIGDGSIYLVSPSNTGQDHDLALEISAITAKIDSGEIMVPESLEP